jgi:hypothetical protein
LKFSFLKRYVKIPLINSFSLLEAKPFGELRPGVPRVLLVDLAYDVLIDIARSGEMLKLKPRLWALKVTKLLETMGSGTATRPVAVRTEVPFDCE